MFHTVTTQTRINIKSEEISHIVAENALIDTYE